MDIPNNLTCLRTWMKRSGFSAMVIPSTDPHGGEYVPAHWEIRKWITGFSGSAGTAVITTNEAALWTDSRYFIQASEQLAGTGIILMKDRLPDTPTIGAWLSKHLEGRQKIAICGEMFAHQDRETLARDVRQGLEVVSCSDPFSELWKERPLLPLSNVYPQPLEYSGICTKEKLSMVRQEMEKEGVDYLLVTALDEIAWITNLRGSDVHCNPVFVSYLLIQFSKATIYIHTQQVSEDIQAYLCQQGIQIKVYEDIFQDAKGLHSIWIDPAYTNQAIFECLCAPITEKKTPVSSLKSIKNSCEIDGFHQAMIRDGVAMVKFLKWLKPAVSQCKETELTISNQLECFRAGQDKYLDISFDTISAYAAHGAIVHYEPTPETDIPVKPEGFLLLDSGAQYLDGTTDITRTIPLGPLTEEMKLDYTLVLKGFIQLGLAKFPTGTSGTQVDILARQFLWRKGKNYLHGTGHGVGSHLCVHEGPHQIRMNYVPAELKAGMTVTDEPGIYREGKYGIRTENTLLIVPYMHTEFGDFLQFEHLTLCPIDLEPVLLPLLSSEEISWLNQYHDKVYTSLSPFLGKEEKQWLKEATKTI